VQKLVIYVFDYHQDVKSSTNAILWQMQ